jgi:formylglycine-generating enzyme required for sulfatase activity
MDQSRREFLGNLARAGCLALTPAGVARALEPGAPPALAEDFQGSVPAQERVVSGISLRWCPPGKFLMGSPASEPGHRPDEAQVEVSLSKGFWTGTFEVTQGQWTRIVGAFPERLPSARFGEGEDVPVYWVSFLDAERFCANLTERAHQSQALPAGWEFRLPTEAQWEYACRAGTTTATSFGDAVDPRQVNFNGEFQRADRRAPTPGSAREVGSYPANPWGLHDMHGNVWEWCRDWYHARLPGGTDPDLYTVVGASNRDGTHSRVRRGGAWIEDGWACRSACRLPFEPPRRSDHIGFRVVAVER